MMASIAVVGTLLHSTVLGVLGATTLFPCGWSFLRVTHSRLSELSNERWRHLIDVFLLVLLLPRHGLLIRPLYKHHEEMCHRTV